MLVLEQKKSDFKALKAGLYISRINALEIVDEKKWQSEELEKKVKITFGIVYDALNKTVIDINEESFNPLSRLLWKSYYPTLRTKKKGMPVSNTKLGDLMAGVGLDTTDATLDLEKSIGKFVILNVEMKPKPSDPTTMKNNISGVSPYTGDITELNKVVDAAEKDANVPAKEIEEIAYEEAGKKKA